MVKVDLPPEPRSATRARQLTREQLAASCPEEAVEVAALLVTELVSNAILHARTDIVLIVDVVPGRVVLRVRDGSEIGPVARGYGPRRPRAEGSRSSNNSRASGASTALTTAKKCGAASTSRPRSTPRVRTRPRRDREAGSGAVPERPGSAHDESQPAPTRDHA